MLSSQSLRLVPVISTHIVEFLLPVNKKWGIGIPQNPFQPHTVAYWDGSDCNHMDLMKNSSWITMLPITKHSSSKQLQVNVPITRSRDLVIGTVCWHRLGDCFYHRSKANGNTQKQHTMPWYMVINRCLIPNRDFRLGGEVLHFPPSYLRMD